MLLAYAQPGTLEATSITARVARPVRNRVAAGARNGPVIERKQELVVAADFAKIRLAGANLEKMDENERNFVLAKENILPVLTNFPGDKYFKTIFKHLKVNFNLKSNFFLENAGSTTPNVLC